MPIQSMGDNLKAANPQVLLLPRELLENKELSLVEKIVLAYYQQFAPFESRIDCAVAFDLSYSEVERAEKHLESLGLLSTSFTNPSWDALKDKSLSPAARLVYARFLYFADYKESMTECREALNLSRPLVAEGFKELVDKGYLNLLSNGKYAKGEPEKKDEKPTVPETQPFSPTPKVDLASLNIRASSSEEPRKRQDKFEKKYYDYLPAYDHGLIFLRDHHIPVTDSKQLKKDFAALVDTFSAYPASDVVGMLKAYFAYLSSPEYEYQILHNQYCPQIYTQNDLYRKFVQIRKFKNSDERQYDPTKTLTK